MYINYVLGSFIVQKNIYDQQLLGHRRKLPETHLSNIYDTQKSHMSAKCHETRCLSLLRFPTSPLGRYSSPCERLYSTQSSEEGNHCSRVGLLTYLFIHSFNKHLLKVYSVQNTTNTDLIKIYNC